MIEPDAGRADMRGSGTPTYGRLRPGLSVEQAQQEATDLAHRIATARGQPTNFDVRLRSLYDETVTSYRGTINILTWAVAAINAWNRVAISFRSVPGVYQPKSTGGG